MILYLVLSFHPNVGILKAGSENWTNAALSVFITYTLVVFEYIEEYYFSFVGSLFLIRKLDDVRTQIIVPDSTVI